MMGQLIPTHRVEKPWGRDDLPGEFGGAGDKRIGEIWFDPPAQLEQILVKYLFTSDKLSVQAHPSDANSPSGRGKEECWLIIAADPGARLALGFNRAIGEQELRASALDGSIEELLAWHEVAPGDFFYVPAGTVHAIGEGLTLVEVQQNCGLTYRLYDYGRPRDLHLAEATAVAVRAPYDPAVRSKVAPDTSALLVDGPHFRLAHIAGEGAGVLADKFCGPVQLVPLHGDVTAAGLTLAPGQSAWCESIEQVSAASDSRWLVCAPLS